MTNCKKDNPVFASFLLLFLYVFQQKHLSWSFTTFRTLPTMNITYTIYKWPMRSFTLKFVFVSTVLVYLRQRHGVNGLSGHLVYTPCLFAHDLGLLLALQVTDSPSASPVHTRTDREFGQPHIPYKFFRAVWWIPGASGQRTRTPTGWSLSKSCIWIWIWIMFSAKPGVE